MLITAGVYSLKLQACSSNVVSRCPTPARPWPCNRKAVHALGAGKPAKQSWLERRECKQGRTNMRTRASWPVCWWRFSACISRPRGWLARAASVGGCGCHSCVAGNGREPEMRAGTHCVPGARSYGMPWRRVCGASCASCWQVPPLGPRCGYDKNQRCERARCLGLRGTAAHCVGAALRSATPALGGSAWFQKPDAVRRAARNSDLWGVVGRQATGACLFKFCRYESRKLGRLIGWPCCGVDRVVAVGIGNSARPAGGLRQRKRSTQRGAASDRGPG